MKKRIAVGLLILTVTALLCSCGAAQQAGEPQADKDSSLVTTEDAEVSAAPDAVTVETVDAGEDVEDVGAEQGSEIADDDAGMEAEPPISSGNAAQLSSANTTLYVLMYHHFVLDGEACTDWTTTDTKFREDLQWLIDNGYSFVLPSELAAGKALPKKAVLISMDDGYASNYNIAFPILREFNAKAVISLIVTCQANRSSGWLTWDMCREMADSGLVEFGSHTYASHSYVAEYDTYGIQRRPGEAQAEYEERIFTDLQRSIDEIETNIGTDVLLFAYPHGKMDDWATDFINEHFAVTLLTLSGSSDISGGLHGLFRFNVNSQHGPSDYLP